MSSVDVGATQEIVKLTRLDAVNIGAAKFEGTRFIVSVLVLCI